MGDIKKSEAELTYERIISRWSDKELEKLKLLLWRVSEDEESKARELAKIAPISLEDIQIIKESSKKFGQIEGLTTGYWQIDNMTAGLASGELSIIMGGTNMGKSLLAVNLAVNQALAGHRVVFVTLETDALNLKKRIWQIIGEENFNLITLQKNFFIQINSRIPYTSIKYLVQEAKEKYKADIVYIDHLHYFARDMQDQATGLGIITQEFKIIALENQIPIVLISHIKKQENRFGRPDVDDARGSSFIGQDADIVLSVWQNPKEYSNEHILVGLQKNRNRVIWKNWSSAVFNRDGVKILPSEYSLIEDAEWNVRKEIREKYEQQYGAKP